MASKIEIWRRSFRGVDLRTLFFEQLLINSKRAYLEGRNPAAEDDLYTGGVVEADVDMESDSEEADLRKRNLEIIKNGAEANQITNCGKDGAVVSPDTSSDAEAEAEAVRDDASNLTMIGGALLHLSELPKYRENRLTMAEDAVSNLEKALLVSSRRPDTLWLLGKAHTAIGFYTPQLNLAIPFFKKGTDYLKQAVIEDPQNQVLLHTLMSSVEAPKMHEEAVTDKMPGPPKIVDTSPKPFTDYNSRIHFFEQTCTSAEVTHTKNPHDAQNLCCWGEALLELSESPMYKHKCLMLAEDAVLKLNEAFLLGSANSYMLWLLGKGYTLRGIYTQDKDQAKLHFDKATDFFKRAVIEEPHKRMYHSFVFLPYKVMKDDYLSREARFFSLDKARKKAEVASTESPLDDSILSYWAGVLLQLSLYQKYKVERMKLLDDAISKLDKALCIKPQKDDTWHRLGIAHTVKGFYMPDLDHAKICFSKANHYFEKAAKQNPQNKFYSSSLILLNMAPELHLEYQWALRLQPAFIGVHVEVPQMLLNILRNMGYNQALEVQPEIEQMKRTAGQAFDPKQMTALEVQPEIEQMKRTAGQAFDPKQMTAPKKLKVIRLSTKRDPAKLSESDELWVEAVGRVKKP